MVDLQLNLHTDIQTMWQMETNTNLKEEWTYGWDAEDQELYGPIGYDIPEDGYEIRRYFLEDDTTALHTSVQDYQIPGNHLQTRFDFGYHDVLAWNAFPPMEHQNVVIDESDLQHVTAYTHSNINHSRAESSRISNTMYDRNFNQPEDVFAGYRKNLFISSNMDDYDYYDPETHTYYMSTDMTLYPVTYIYLAQLRLHHNEGRIKGVAGGVDLDGMARVVDLNTGVTNNELVAVEFDMRMKKDLTIQKSGEVVDVVGGKCVTFGIPGQNSYFIKSEAEVNQDSRHSMGVNLKFYTDIDSMFVFDVTDQVHRQWKGGIITIDIDVDTIKFPVRPGGGGMDAVVKDFDEEEHEFEIK